MGINTTYFAENLDILRMGINTVWSTCSVSVFCRDFRHFTCFLKNSLCSKTVEMIVYSKLCEEGIH